MNERELPQTPDIPFSQRVAMIALFAMRDDWEEARRVVAALAPGERHRLASTLEDMAAMVRDINGWIVGGNQ